MINDSTKIAIIICVFVLAREFRPIEPFLTAYLTQPPLNLTTTEVNEKVYPTGTYASLSLVVVIFIVTDYLRYKPIIILDGLAGVMTYALLLGKPSMTLLKIEQIFYGFFYASDVATTTYLYAKIQDASLYQKMTGYVRASSLIGRFTNGVFSQSMVSLNILKLNELMYASIAGMIFVTMWAFTIPSVRHSLYFHRKEHKKHASTTIENTNTLDLNSAAVKTQKLKDVGICLWNDFKTAYRNLYVLKWSAWWAFNLTVCYFVSAAAVYLICKTRFNWSAHGDWILASVTALLSLLLIYLYTCENLWLAYVAYVSFEILFHALFTIAQSEVAQNLREDSFVLIFGFNNFVALSLSSILTYTMIEGKVELFNFTTRQQFLFFGVYLCVVTIVTLCRAVINLCGSIVQPSSKYVSTLEL